MGTVIIYFLPFSFNKYKITLKNTLSETDESIYVYRDLDGDGESEKIRFILYAEGQPQSMIVYHNGGIIDQWNYTGHFAKDKFYGFTDYDHDGFEEIIMFTCRNDSNFCQVVAPFNKNKSELIKDLYIGPYKPMGDQLDHFFTVIDQPDIDGDGYKDIIFSINAAYTCLPRRLYALNIRKREIRKSPEAGAILIYPECFDLDGDGKNDYIFSCPANGNCTEYKNLKYPDTCGWVVVFNRQLKYVFQPVPLGRFTTGIWNIPVVFGGQKYLLVSKISQGSEKDKNALLLYNAKGKLVKEKAINIRLDEMTALFSRDRKNRSDAFLMTDHFVYQIDEDLNLTEYQKNKKIQFYNPVRVDIDLDGKEEYIFS